MITTTDFDLRLAEHMARVARVDRDVWTRAATGPTGVPRTLSISPVIASMRQRMGAAVVYVGERLQGTTVRHAADPSAL